MTWQWVVLILGGWWAFVLMIAVLALCGAIRPATKGPLS